MYREIHLPVVCKHTPLCLALGFYPVFLLCFDNDWLQQRSVKLRLTSWKRNPLQDSHHLLFQECFHAVILALHNAFLINNNIKQYIRQSVSIFTQTVYLKSNQLDRFQFTYALFTFTLLNLHNILNYKAFNTDKHQKPTNSFSHQTLQVHASKLSMFLHIYLGAAHRREEASQLSQTNSPCRQQQHNKQLQCIVYIATIISTWTQQRL